MVRGHIHRAPHNNWVFLALLVLLDICVLNRGVESSRPHSRFMLRRLVYSRVELAVGTTVFIFALIFLDRGEENILVIRIHFFENLGVVVLLSLL